MCFSKSIFLFLGFTFFSASFYAQIPTKILSPVRGTLTAQSDGGVNCNNTRTASNWCFNQWGVPDLQGNNGGNTICPGTHWSSGDFFRNHLGVVLNEVFCNTNNDPELERFTRTLGGIDNADDTYSWDANLCNNNCCGGGDCDDGIPVYAIESGIVERVTPGSGEVLLRHTKLNEDVWFSSYMHMNNIDDDRMTVNDFSVGEFIKAGSQIGSVSNRAASNNHLHFTVYELMGTQLISRDREIIENGIQVNFGQVIQTGPAFKTNSIGVFFEIPSGHTNFHDNNSDLVVSNIRINGTNLNLGTLSLAPQNSNIYYFKFSSPANLFENNINYDIDFTVEGSTYSLNAYGNDLILFKNETLNILENAWYASYLEAGLKANLFNGISPENFTNPNKFPTKEVAVKYIVEAAIKAGVNDFDFSNYDENFSDLTLENPYFPYILALKNKGLSLQNNIFDLNKNINLSELCLFIKLAFNLSDADKSKFEPILSNFFTKITIDPPDENIDLAINIVNITESSSPNNFKAENLILGRRWKATDFLRASITIVGSDPTSFAQFAKILVNTYGYKKNQLESTTQFNEVSLSKSRNSVTEFESTINTITIIGGKFEGISDVSGNTPGESPTLEITMKDNESKELGYDTNSQLFFYWTANGGEIKPVFKNTNKKIRFKPPTVSKPTLFRLYSYIANAQGKSREAFIEITVNPSNTTTTTLDISPENVDFGSITAGTTTTKTLTLTNPATSNNAVSGHLEMPTQYAFFSLETDANYNLAPGESKQFTLKFLPHQKGNYNAGLSVHHDASGQPSPVTVNLIGQGLENTTSTELSCAVQIPLNCNQLYEGSTVNAINTNNSYQGLSYNYSGGEVVHTFYPPADGNYQVSFLDLANGYLDLVILDGCDNQNVVGKIFGGGGRRYGSFNFDKNTPYYFVVDGRDQTVGAYRIKLETCPEVPNDGCIISSLDRIDFGYQEPSGTITYVEDLTIRNVSTTSSLEVSISFSGTNAANFSVAHTSFTLGPGQVQLVAPVWNAEANKDYDVEMQITHNSDVCSSPIRIPVTGSTISRYVWTYPVDGSVLRNNQSNTITWQGSGAGNVEIEISLDGGVTWTSFSERDDNGTFTFTREGLCTEKGKFRIRKHPFDDPWTETEGFFSIKDKVNDPQIYFTYPNGFETFEAGDLLPLTWEFSGSSGETFGEGIPRDGLFYIVNGNWSNKLLIARDNAGPHDELYEWIIPSFPADTEVNFFFDYLGDDDETACPIYVKTAPTTLSFKYYTTENSCTGATDGKIILAPVGGTSPYTYQWAYNGTTIASTSNRLKDLQDGDYAFTITDAANNQTNATIGLTSVNNMAAFPQINDATCGGADGSVAFSITGGTLPYTFDAGNGTTPSTLVPNLTPGRHNISITDNSTCVLVIPVEIGNQENAPDPFFTHQANGTTLSFTNTSTGAARTWNWDFGDNTTASTASPAHTYANSGLYTVCLTATNDCGANIRCSDIFVGGANSDVNLFTKLYEGSEVYNPNLTEVGDGNMIVNGYFSNGSDGEDVTLFKVSQLGELIWTKRLLNNNQMGASISGGIKRSESGGIYFGIYARGLSGGSDPAYQNSLVKMNQNGEIVWHKGFQLSNGEELSNRTFSVFSSGVLIGGSRNGNFVLNQINHSGGINWAKEYDLFTSFGIDREEHSIVPSRILKTTDGGILLTGNFWKNFGDASLKYRVFVIKMNSTGTIQWSKLITGGKSDFPANLLETNGAYYITGLSNSFTGNSNNEPFLVKITTSGSLSWIKGYESTNSTIPKLTQVSSNGNLEIYSNTSFLEINANDGSIVNQNGIALGTSSIHRIAELSNGYLGVSGHDTNGLWLGKINKDGDSKCGSREVNYTTSSRSYAYSSHSNAASTTLSVSSGNLNIINTTGISYQETNLCPTPTCDVILSINAVDETCGQNNGAAIANVTGGVPPYIFKWSSVPDQNTQALNNLSAGNYFLTVEDNFGCSKTASFIITDDNTNLTANYTASSDGLKVNLASTSTGANGYFWDFGDNAISGENNPVHTFDCSGSYLVELTTANDCGYETIGKTVTVDVPDNLLVNGDAESKVYQADKTITSDGKILIGREVEFKATETITLSNGFHAQAGSQFLAEIVEDCPDVQDCLIPTSGLVAYYPFTGNTNDASGNTHNATASGVALSNNRLNEINNAYTFDGSNDYITVPNHADFNLTTFTISAWIKLDNTNGVQAIIARGESFDTDKIQYGLFTKENKLEAWYEQDNDDDIFLTSTTILSVNQWHFVTFSRSSAGDVKLYLNGNLEQSTNAPAPVASITNNLDIGRRTNSPNIYQDFFDGNIDEVRIYNRALSDVEISSLYTDCNQSALMPTNTVESAAKEIDQHEELLRVELPSDNLLLKIFPNPFQSQTTIKYYLPERAKVNILVTNFLGEKIKALEANTLKQKGNHEIQFQSDNLLAGTYFLVLTSNGQMQTEKMVIVH